MAPWLDWLDWLTWDFIGAGLVGKILGLWFRALVTLVKQIVKVLFRNLGAGRTTRTNLIDQRTMRTGNSSATHTRAI